MTELISAERPFLALPVIAILKTVFDRIDSLKPWRLLLGDEEPTVKRPLFVRRKGTPVEVAKAEEASQPA